ncbi:MAG: UDP-N-acetylmuramate--L-alanine ligase, partial [Clostridia bacterium]|nr:UDP-N-acetylmuramate--L-alanine ligase [Clostridia bacterium]
IGGISMSGLAEIMLSNGFKVTGSDRQKSHITDKLESKGAVIFEGHKSENIKGADLVVYTAAAKADNPEIVAAKEQGIFLLNRAEFLGALMKEYPNTVCIAGTHGKTTTTSILAHALLKADTDATVSIGGELDLIGGNIRAGGKEYFLTEACEYTNSFLSFYPTVAVITNIEEDHLDFFSGLDEIIESFRKFAYLTEGVGSVIACGDDENVRKALSDTALDVHYYGISSDNSYYAENIAFNSGYPEFDVMKKGEKLVHLHLNVPGNHNIQNAVAAIAVCDILKLPLSVCADGIEEFCGTHRRFEKKGTLNGATVIDDYAHHPTEIAATLAAARKFDYNKLWCVFQPHTYSRTRTLWKEFCECFDNVDELILTHIYAAREVFDGVTRPEKLAEDIAKRGVKVRYVEKFSDIEELLRSEVKDGDVVFTMGAGNVVDIADNLC